MKHKNKIISIFLLIIFAFCLACEKQQAETSKAQSPTEAYKMLFAACKAKDAATIKQLMSKSSLGLAEMQAGMQKKSVDEVLRNGLLAPTLAPSLTEIRDERIKDNFGRIEVFNQTDNRWEDLPFVLEDGSWKVAVGDIFQNTFDPNQTIQKGKGQMEMESSNKMMPMNSNGAMKMPEIINGNKPVAEPTDKKDKSVEVQKEEKPKK